ncbi:MAG: hypothetical protein ACRD5M_03300 [Candidatus Acidiferrales bacterium]
MKAILIITIVHAVLSWVYSRSNKTEVSTVDGVTVFPVTGTTRWLLMFSVLMFISMMVGGFLIRSWPIAAFGVAFALFGILSWPHAIVADQDGLKSARLLRHNLFIPWHSMKSVSYNTVNHNTTVAGADGSKICHTGFHAAPETLHSLITHHTNVKVQHTEPGWFGQRNIN